MLRAGDVVTVNFLGAKGLKRRPAVVLTGDAYHAQRPDIVLGVLTTNLGAAKTDFDHVLQDWSAAGLNAPSAFRTYLGMATPENVKVIGHLSERDWESVKERLRRAFSLATVAS